MVTSRHNRERDQKKPNLGVGMKLRQGGVGQVCSVGDDVDKGKNL